jgi:CBS domain containing-hemolysin-like protein
VIVNGLFVAAEIGLVRSRRARLEVLANQGASSAKLALGQIARIDEYIAACQVGITLCSIGIGFLGEPSLAKIFEPVFGGLSPMPRPDWTST